MAVLSSNLRGQVVIRNPVFQMSKQMDVKTVWGDLGLALPSNAAAQALRSVSSGPSLVIL